MEYALLASVVITSTLIGGATVRKAVQSSPLVAGQFVWALQALERITGPDPNSRDACLQTMQEDTAQGEERLACRDVFPRNAITAGRLAQDAPPSAMTDLRNCCAAAR